MVIRPNRSTYAVLTLIVFAGLTYLELYPFTFRFPAGSNGPLHALLESWANRPSRGDFVANIAAYIPLGFSAAMSLGAVRPRLARMGLVCLAGAALSVCFELAQYYIEGRVTAATDVYANTAGLVLGATVASLSHSRSFSPFRFDPFRQPIPLALIVDWAAYRLYPYVPTADIHKFWVAIKPLVVAPTLNWPDLLRHAAIWLTLFSLGEVLAGARRSFVVALLVAASLTGARITIVDRVLSTAEVTGGLVALAVWPLLLAGREHLRASIVAAALIAYIVVERLQPFAFVGSGREFGWVPFRSFMAGSPELNVMAFFEKTFLYGGCLYLLGQAGWRLRKSSLLLALLLFVTTWAEIYLPGRSAEITDAVLVLLIASAFGLVRRAETAHPAVIHESGK